MKEIISLVSEVASLVNTAALVIFLYLVKNAISAIKGIPGSGFSIEVEGLGKGSMSLGDMKALIADQLVVVSEREREELRKFNTPKRTPGTAVPREVLEAMLRHSLVRGHRDAKGQEVPRLAPLGYRLLGDFMNIQEKLFKPWEWLEPEEQEALS